MILVTSGVGQGSVNGPFLFISFFDDSDPLMDEILALNFADDKKLGGFITCNDDAEHLQNGIDRFSDWCNDNKLRMNVQKCKVITFSRIKNPIIHTYTINGVPVKRVNETMDLGVMFQENGKFHSHWEYVTNRAVATSKFVKRQSVYYSMETIKLIYQLLVRSLLEFATTIWSPNHLIHRSRIESVQKQMVLFLLGDNTRYLTKSYELSPYKERCTRLGLSTLIRRRTNAIIMFMHAIISGKYQSPHLRSMITLNPATRSLRRPNFIMINRHDDSPFTSACRLFNVAATYLDPTLPRACFRSALMNLPDECFGEWLSL